METIKYQNPFPDEKVFEETFLRCLDEYRTPKKLRNQFVDSRKSLEREFEKYLAFNEKEQFRFAYICGWNDAKNSLQNSLSKDGETPSF